MGCQVSTPDTMASTAIRVIPHSSFIIVLSEFPNPRTCPVIRVTSECRRARDAKRDIPVPLSPCARATTCTCRGRPAPGPRLRHFAPPPDPYDEWLDGVSDALASGLRQLRDLRPLRHFGQPLAPTPTADYPPRASRFPGGQRMHEICLKLFIHRYNTELLPIVG